jgi:multidrug efflux pump subunit AcrB
VNDEVYNIFIIHDSPFTIMIADTFIKRPVTAIVISIVIVLVGLIAMTTLPVAQYPNITPPTVSIAGNFTGADAQTVEQLQPLPLKRRLTVRLA